MSAYKVLILGLVSLSLFAQGQEAINNYSIPDARNQIMEPKSQITDLDSLNCRFVGNWPFGPSYAVSYDSIRNLAFLGSGGGVYILDVSNPSSPRKVSDAIYTRRIVREVFYKNNRLYIAVGDLGLEIWDVTNPSSPSKLGSYNALGWAWDVYITGSYAYVADGVIPAHLRIIDISNPANPFEVGNCGIQGVLLAFMFPVLMHILRMEQADFE